MKKFLSIFSLSFLTQLFWVKLAQAQTPDAYYGVNDLVEQGVNLGNRNLVQSVAGIINLALGFLGVLAIIFILYGGFVWMTSAGLPDKIKRAKQIIIAAVIGLAIVLSAFAISSFVINNLSGSTGMTGGTPGGGGGPGPLPTCPEPANATDIAVCSVVPSSRGVGGAVTIKGWHFDTYNPATSKVRFDNGTDSADAEVVMCGPNITWKQTATPRYFQIKVLVPNLPIANNYTVEVINAVDTGAWSGVFDITGAAAGPSLFCLDPDNGPVLPAPTQVTAHGLRFGDGTGAGDHIQMAGDAGPIQITLADVVSWADNQIVFNLKPNTISGDTLVNVGGNDSNPEYFQVTCGNDNGLCTSGCCQNNACRLASACTTPPGGPGSGPHIDSIDPNNGAVGNIVTIYGSNFGATAGTVRFTGSTGMVTGTPPPACLANFWTDRYITVQVPTLNQETVQVDIQTAAPASLDSNAVAFTVNTTGRPGLCSVAPNAGVFGMTLSLAGNKFTSALPSDDILFGNISGDNKNILSGSSATVDVPNLVGGTVGIQIKNMTSGELSNTLPFTVQNVAGGAPVINSILENNQPEGAYVTIVGANFGNTPGVVKFAGTLGDFNFPPQCSDSYWRNDRVIVKIPNGVGNGVKGVVLTNNSNLSNNPPFNYTVNNANPKKPGICKVQPDNGPVGTLVDFFGDNFGNTKAKVTFYQNQDVTGGDIAAWNNKQALDVKVPNGAQTGQVVLVDTANNISNAINFSVGSCPNDNYCQTRGLGQVCCPGNAGDFCAPSCAPVATQCLYPWDITSAPNPFGLMQFYCGEGDYQTPSPWPHQMSDLSGTPHDSLDSYIDSNLVINFTRDVIDADLENQNNFKVFQCTGQNTGCTTPVAGTLTIVNESSNEEGVMFDPSADLAPDTWYQVILGTDLFHATVGGDVWPNVAAGEIAPDWNFKTRANNDACVPTSVSVSPTSPAADILLNKTRKFTAVPRASNCNICGGNYDWTWSKTVDPSPGQVNTFSPANNSLSPKGSTIVTGKGRTDPNPLVMRATIDGINPPVFGEAQCVIRAPQLAIIDYGPNCMPACANSTIFVEFNYKIASASLSQPQYWRLYDAANNVVPTSMSTLVTGIAPNETMIVILGVLPGSPLVNGQTYHVVISGAVRSDDDSGGDTLGADFSWSFTVSNSSECRISAVDVRPNNYLATALMGIPYTIIPLANTDSCGLVPVNCDATCTYNWSSDNLAVATLLSSNIQSPLVAAFSQGVAHITGTITHRGQPFSETETLTVNLNTPGSFPFSIIAPYLPAAGVPACMNSAVTVNFSTTLDRASVPGAIKLYEHVSAAPGPNCLADAISSGGSWCPYAARYSTQDINMDADPEKETQVVLHPRNVLAGGTEYLVIINNTIKSRLVGGIFGPGVPPVLPQINVDGVGGNEGYGWRFTTGSAICQISFSEVVPSSDNFTCAYDNCLGDEDGGTAGNQHSYMAKAYDALGNQLTVPNHNWRSMSSLLNLGANNDATMVASPGNTDGVDTLAVTMSGANMGSSVASAKVNIFTCANPWPDAVGGTWLPWIDRSNSDADLFHFSSSYCQARNTGDTPLPSLHNDPASIVHDDLSADLLREYIFFVDPAITDNTQRSPKSPFGTLARKNNNAGDAVSWLDKVKNLWSAERAEGAGVNPTPQNLSFTVTGADSIKLTWSGGNNPQNFVMQRKLASDTTWTDLGPLIPATVFEYDSNAANNSALQVGDSYNYRVGAKYAVGGTRYSAPINVLNFGVSTNVRDIIGVRVMRNYQHLSVSEWYRRLAPNASTNGNLIQVDGYEALQVGGTTYVAATSLTSHGGNIYTNIFIIAHNIGANADTVNIYNQLIDNFKFNINIIQQNDNLCTNPDVNNNNNLKSCSSDFDCIGVQGDYLGACRSSGLKIRRDMQRLGAMMSVSKNVDDYGLTHKYCSNDANRLCVNSSDCPAGGACTNYYPLLGSGSFVAGMSTSRWPISWDQTLSTAVGRQLPHDPINRFNGCPAAMDPDTCWDAVGREFQCGPNSMVILYQSKNNGTNYQVTGNFEYDMFFAPGNKPFTDKLQQDGGVRNIPHLSADLNSICNASISNPPGPGNARCGDGLVDSDGVDNILGNADDEQCDANFTEYICRDRLGGFNWWNEQRAGCNPPGTPNQCQWANVTVTPAICGGYCGDGTLQTNYELCEGSNFNGVHYTCAPGRALRCAPLYCQPICEEFPVPNPAIYDPIAEACGDGRWAQGIEECDASGNPDGLEGWGCSSGGTLTCNNLCERSCSSGTDTQAICGNGVKETGEACEYVNYVTPNKNLSNANNAYTCTSVCSYTGQPFCGDGVKQSEYGEQCDGVYTPPTPAVSNDNNQYECGDPMTANACEKKQGGYCGNASVEASYGERCDRNWTAPSPGSSANDNQYECSNACTPTQGGWCGDGSVQTTFSEECDPSSSNFLGWSCDDGSPITCSNSCTRVCATGNPTSSVCGDGDVTGTEQCDVASYSPPTPSNSSISAQYSCDNVAPNRCRFTGGYCGDSSVQGPQELCDPGAYTAPLPQASNSNNQYACVTVPNANACKPLGGGYCGDGVQPPQLAFGEQCEPVNHVSPPPAIANNINKQYDCGAAGSVDACKSNVGGWCGDGTWQQAKGEECDGAAGLTGWSCSPAGTLGCSATCARTCTGGGTPVNVVCGDGNTQAPEQCDPPADPRPGVTPQNSTAANQYVCGSGANACMWLNKYCGNGTTENTYGEQCDPSGFVSPTPQASSNTNQYTCGAVATANACQGQGGYCGDNTRNGTEFCDGSSYTITPAASDATHQYVCSTAAATKCTVANAGGYCRDGSLQAGFGEQCDDGNSVNGDDCSNACTFSCIADAQGFPSGVVSTADVSFGNHWYMNFDFNFENNNGYFTPGWTNVIDGDPGDGTSINLIYDAVDGWGFDPAVTPTAFGIGGATRASGTTMTRDYLRRGSALAAGDARNYPIFKIRVPANGQYGVTVYRGDTQTATTFAFPMDIQENGVTIGTVAAQVGLNVTKSSEMIANVNDGFLDLRLNSAPYCTPAAGCSWGLNGLQVRQIVANTGPSVTLQNNQSSTINLPQCRVSGDVVTNVYVDPGTTGTTFAIIAVANNTQSRVCVADSNVGVGNIWSPPFANDCTQSATNGVGTADDHIGRTNDKTVVQAMQYSLPTILNNMQAAVPNMDVAMLHFGWGDPTMGGACTWGCGSVGWDFSLINDNLYYGYSQYMPISQAISVMPNFINSYNGQIINDPATVDVSDPSDLLAYAKRLFNQADPLYDNLIFVVLDTGKRGWGGDNTYISEWNSTAEPTKIDDLKAMGVKVVTLDYFHFSTVGGSIWTKYESTLNAVSSNNCVCGSDTNFCWTNIGGSCGDGIVQCGTQSGVLTAPAYWPSNPTWNDEPLRTEECDGQPGCNANCKWTNRSLARKFSVREDSSVGAGWLLAPPQGVFSASSNISTIEINSGSGWTNIGLPATLPGTINNVHLDTRSLNAASCNIVSPPNSLPFTVRFNAGALPNASVTLGAAASGGVYNYCHW